MRLQHALHTRVIMYQSRLYSHTRLFCFLVPVLFGSFGYFLSVCVPVCMLLDVVRRRRVDRRRCCPTMWPRPRRELPRLEHRISRNHAHVSGRGCFHCFCDDGSLLQVSCSTQKLLPVPQVSEQNEPGSLTYTLFLIALPYVTFNSYLYLCLYLSHVVTCVTPSASRLHMYYTNVLYICTRPRRPLPATLPDRPSSAPTCTC